MATQPLGVHNCRIYREDQLQYFNPNQPFSTVGGYADLFRASHPEDGELALKRPRWGTGDLTDRFKLATQEAGVWQVLRHPNVLAFLGILYSSPHIYLISPFALHGSLPQYLMAHSDVDRAIFIPHIAAGLAYLHSQNVIHGDVKGANILVSHDLIAQLCDFGLSKFADTATSHGVKGGSLPWLSPERIDHPTAPRTKASDVYAFGMTIYEILSSFTPFHTLSVDELRIAVCIHDARPPASPEVSSTGTSYMPLWLLAGNCWNKNPERRLSMEEVQERIAPGGAIAVAYPTWEGTPSLPMPPPSSDAVTLRRKRIDSVPNVTDMADMDELLQQYGGDFLRPTGLTQIELPNRASKRQKVSNREEISNNPRTRHSLLNQLGDADNGVGDRTPDPDDLLCLSGTREDILAETDRWFSDPAGSPVLWINGVAGCGKSALATTIAHRRKTSSAVVAMFYFNRGNQARNKRVVCSLSRQLAASNTTLGQHVLQCIQDDPDIPSQPLAIQFQQLIIEPLKGPNAAPTPVLLVVDALDEWDDHRAASKFIDLIQHLHAQAPYTARFVVTSRNEPYLVTSFQSASMRLLVAMSALDEVSEADINHDIKTFLNHNFAIIRSTHPDVLSSHWPPGKDVDTLVHLSCGLFQWVSTVTSYVKDRRPRGRLRDILSHPDQFKGLDNLYHGILDRVFQNEPDTPPSQLRDVLGAILVAPIPISAAAMAYLAAEDPGAVSETVEMIAEEILPSIRALLIVPKGLDEPIRISHSSVRDYLTNQQRCTDERFHIDHFKYHTRMAKSGLTRMERNLTRNMCEIDDPSLTNDEIEDEFRTRIPSGLKYSCRYWAHHLSLSSNDNLTELADLLHRFSIRHLLHWVEVLSLSGDLDYAFTIAKDAERWLETRSSPNPSDFTTIALLRDVQRFVTMFFEPITIAPAHIYLSALQLAPPQTEIVRRYQEITNTGLRPLPGPKDTHWPASLWVAGKHTAAVHCVTFSPDDAVIASAGYDNTIRLWKRESGVGRGTPLVGHTGYVQQVVFSPNENTIASCSNDGTIRLWDVDAGTQIGDPVPLVGQCLAFSSDGSMIAVGSRVNVRLLLWDGASAVPSDNILEGDMNDLVIGVAFSLDGNTISALAFGGDISVWEVESGIHRRVWQSAHVDEFSRMFMQFALSPDGAVIAVGDEGGTISLRDTAAGLELGEWPTGSGVFTCLAFSPDGKTIGSVHRDTLHLWDVESQMQKGDAMACHTTSVSDLAFSRDGKSIATAGIDHTVRLWDTSEDWTLPVPIGHTKAVTCVAISSESRLVASGSYDGAVQLWNADSGDEKRTLLVEEMGAVFCVAFSLDGTLVASGASNSICLWDVASGAKRAELPDCRGGIVERLVFSPNGERIASVSWITWATCEIWDIRDGQKLGITPTPWDRSASISFTARGLLIGPEGYPVFGNTPGGSNDPHHLPDYALIPTSIYPKLFQGVVGNDGWIFHCLKRWFWLPLRSGMWTLCGSCMVVYDENDVYIYDVSHIMYIVE